MREWRRFTLIELLVICAVIAILVCLLLPSLQSAKNTARRIKCLNSQRNLYLGAQVYQDTYHGWMPGQIKQNLGGTNERFWYNLIPAVIGKHPDYVPDTSLRWQAKDMVVCPNAPDDTRRIKLGIRSDVGNFYQCNNISSTLGNISFPLGTDTVFKPNVYVKSPSRKSIFYDSDMWEGKMPGYYSHPKFAANLSSSGYSGQLRQDLVFGRHTMQNNIVFYDGHCSSLGSLKTVELRNIWPRPYPQDELIFENLDK